MYKKSFGGIFLLLAMLSVVEAKIADLCDVLDSDVALEELSDELEAAPEGAINEVRCNTQGDRLLHVAVAQVANLDAVEALLDHGANPLVQNDLGKVAKDYVVEGERPHVFSILAYAEETLKAQTGAPKPEGAGPVITTEVPGVGEEAEKEAPRRKKIKVEWKPKRKGFYAAVDAGTPLLKTKVRTVMEDTDVPTKCDQYFSDPLSLDDPCCARGGSWENSFQLGQGLWGGLQVGYGFENGVRVEGEYFFRGHGGDTNSWKDRTTGKASEFTSQEETLDNYKSNNFFVNAAYEGFFWGDRLMGHFGGGVGMAQTKVDYIGNWVRHSDPVMLEEAGGHPEAAGTVSGAERTLEKNLFAIQYFTGLDYTLNDRMSLGVKLRYVMVEDLIEEGLEWDVLRGHESRISPDESHAPVTYDVDIMDNKSWGAGVRLRFFHKLEII